MPTYIEIKDERPQSNPMLILAYHYLSGINSALDSILSKNHNEEDWGDLGITNEGLWD